MKKQVSLQEELSVVREGVLTSSDRGFSIRIPIDPFVVENGERENTEFVLEDIRLPEKNVQLLANGLFHFPVNPADGHIDASVYISGQHVPVNVYQLIFGESKDGFLPCRLNISVHFSAVGMDEYADIPLEFRVILKIVE